AHRPAAVGRFRQRPHLRDACGLGRPRLRASSDGDTMNAFSVGGRKLWTVHTGAYVYSSPAVWGGRVFFGSHNGFLYCVSVADGPVQRRYGSGAPISGAPSVVGNIV